MKKYIEKAKVLLFLCFTLAFIASFTSSTYSGLASAQNNTSLQPQGIKSLVSNSTNIVLVHGAFVDGSSWSKVIPILEKAGHKVIAVQLPLHSLSDDISTVNRAIDLLGGPTILVGHSYGGVVITNAGYNNPNVIGLVYIAAIVPDNGQATSEFFDISKLPKDFLVFDKGGFAYINPAAFPISFAQDVNTAEAKILAVMQKPINQVILAEKSGPPAWKQLHSWYQISESDHMIPPAAQYQFAKQINATAVSVNSSHAAPISHPDQTAQLILQAAAKGNTR
jgi:pimeloyl-ACP methyl ester carboxylesterase